MSARQIDLIDRSQSCRSKISLVLITPIFWSLIPRTTLTQDRCPSMARPKHQAGHHIKRQRKHQTPGQMFEQTVESEDQNHMHSDTEFKHVILKPLYQYHDPRTQKPQAQKLLGEQRPDHSKLLRKRQPVYSQIKLKVWLTTELSSRLIGLGISPQITSPFEKVHKGTKGIQKNLLKISTGPFFQRWESNRVTQHKPNSWKLFMTLSLTD